MSLCLVLCQENALDALLLLDYDVTQWLCVCAEPRSARLRALKSACVILEMSGHGVPWFLLCGALLLMHVTTAESWYLSCGLSLLSLLLTDIIVVAPMKLFFKRGRPKSNCDHIPLSISSVDKYAFPSGHASRCVALAVYFCWLPPFSIFTHLWYLWALAVSLSRVLIGRHHISDVLVGMIAGLFIFEAVRQLDLLWTLHTHT